MNYFLIDDQKLIIKELTTEEQENFNNFEAEDFLDKKSFEELCEQFLINKEKFPYDILDEETKIAIIKSIIQESDIKKFGDFYILKTFDKINNESNQIIFLIFKQLKEFGYKYEDVKKMSQQTLIELLVYESVYEGKLESLIKTIEEINKSFKNEEINILIQELEKILNNKRNSQIQDVQGKKGFDGLANMK